jgi:hypothetical protein
MIQLNGRGFAPKKWSENEKTSFPEEKKFCRDLWRHY